MAGSWDHIVTRTGKFQGTLLIENLGDAWEALEECYGMVWFLAEALAYRDDMDHLGSQRPARDQILDVIRQAEANYKEGMALGGTAKRNVIGE